MIMNTMCYITFESDEDAQAAYRYLREDVGVFKVSCSLSSPLCVLRAGLRTSIRRLSSVGDP
jgi:hypothetical protein